MPTSQDLPVTLTCERCRSNEIGTLAADRCALVICEACGHEFRVVPDARREHYAISAGVLEVMS
jgi:transcription elongation factor Elf1